MTAARARPGQGSDSFAGALLEAMAEAPALGAGVDDVGLVGDAVDDGLGETGVGEDLGPFAEGQVGGDDQAAAFVAFGDDLEDELGSALGQGQVAQLVDLCGYPHRSSYADTATMPNVSCVGYSKCLLVEWLLALVLVLVSA